MRTLGFYKVSPGGNATILVLDPVPAPERARVARMLMAEGHLQAEQVGYLDLGASPVRLDMMGGEFCGNACRAAAAVMAREGVGLVRRGDALHGELAVSGVDRFVGVRVVPATGECWVDMPLPEADVLAGMVECLPGLGCVPLPGITHLCLDESLHPFPEDFAAHAASLRRRFGIDDCAVGCIWYRSDATCAIKPVVWVRSTNTTHYETGCGSGSLALALWLGRGQNFPLELDVRQPSGGSIGVRIDAGADGPTAWIHGPVALVAKGEAFLTSSSGWPSAPPDQPW
jgi:diaminopimelate epimerase